MLKKLFEDILFNEGYDLDFYYDWFFITIYLK